MDVDAADRGGFSPDGYRKLQAEIRRLQAELDQYREIDLLRSSRGFIGRYFEILPDFRTQIEAFNSLNDRFLELTGEYRYSDYNSFRKSKNRLLKGRV